MDAFFLTQALDEVQVGFVVLGAVDPLRVGGAELETVGVGQDAAGLEDLGDDLRHAEVLVDLLVEVVAQVVELRSQGDAVAGQLAPGITLGDAVHQAVDQAFTGRAKGQAGWFMQEFFELEVGTRADQFDIEAEGLIEGFAANETEDLKVDRGAFDRQGNMGSVSIQHAVKSIH